VAVWRSTLCTEILVLKKGGHDDDNDPRDPKKILLILFEILSELRYFSDVSNFIFLIFHFIRWRGVSFLFFCNKNNNKQNFVCFDIPVLVVE
jgi:hypothetical protein